MYMVQRRLTLITSLGCGASQKRCDRQRVATLLGMNTISIHYRRSCRFAGKPSCQPNTKSGGVMKIEDLQKFSNDLRKVGIEAVTKGGNGIYVIINIGNIDFYFYNTNEKQYDGWGSHNKEIINDLGLQ
jgi:hypothetical protein